MTPHLHGTPPLVRVVNRQVILDLVRRKGAISRAELAKLTQIRPPTVSAVVQQLLDAGLVEEIGSGETGTGTGRPPRMLSLSRRKPRALGFELGPAAIRAGLCNLDGSLAATRLAAHGPCAPEEAVGHLHALGNALLTEAGLAWSELSGVGIALPGLVDASHSLVRWSRPFGWHEVPLRRLAEECWKTRTNIINNSVAASMAEHHLGAAREVRSLIYVFVRFDVVEPEGGKSGQVVRLGSGIIINGEPYHGEFGAAGEISTLVEHPRMRVVDAQGQRLPDTRALLAALVAGDSSAVAAMRACAQEIAVHVLDAINFLDPAMVVLESDYPELREVILARLREIVDEDSLRRIVGHTRIVASALGEFAMLQGSVTPTLRRIFRLPAGVK